MHDHPEESRLSRPILVNSNSLISVMIFSNCFRSVMIVTSPVFPFLIANLTASVDKDKFLFLPQINPMINMATAIAPNTHIAMILSLFFMYSISSSTFTILFLGNFR